MSFRKRAVRRPLALLGAFALLLGLGVNAALGAATAAHESEALTQAAHTESTADEIDPAALPAYLAAARLMSPAAGQVARQAGLGALAREAIGGIWASGGDSFGPRSGEPELDIEFIFDN